MSFREIFKRFLATVGKEMDKSVAEATEFPREFQWKKLGGAGANGVATLLKEKHQLEASPTVVGGEQDGKLIKPFSVSHQEYEHQFWVQEARFKYTRVLNGKTKEAFKRFGAVERDFWSDYWSREHNRKKRDKANTTSIRDNKSYKKYLEIQKEKKEAAKKQKEEEEAAKKQKEEEEAAKKQKEGAENEEEADKKNRANPLPETLLLPEKPLSGTPPLPETLLLPEKPLSGTGPQSETGEAASGDASA